MDYLKLKDTIDIKVFNLLLKIINYPKCDIYLPNYQSLTYDFDSTSIDFTNVIQDDFIFIGNYDCIYTYDKIIVKENDQNLGANYSLVLYVRCDDLPSQILTNITSIKIKFNNVMYSIDTPMNLYNILYEFHLRDN